MAASFLAFGQEYYIHLPSLCDIGSGSWTPSEMVTLLKQSLTLQSTLGSEPL